MSKASLYVLSAILCALLSACQTLPHFGAEAKSTLTNTYWKLTQVNGTSVSVHGDAREPYLLLIPRKQRVEGFAGCNNIDGQYRTQGSQLRFESITNTRMICAGAMALEHAYMDALNQTTHFRIGHDRLTLLDVGNRALARFRARLAD